VTDDPKTVDAAIIAVADEVGAITKSRQAPDDIGAFKFRGIEDALNALHPLLVKHGLNIIPRLTKRDVEAVGRRRLVTVEVEYDFRSVDGSTLTAGPFPGEGADGSDKASNKAMSGAWKLMAFEVFSIPVADTSVDSEAYSPRDDEPPTIAEQWASATEVQSTDAEKEQARLDSLPTELASKVLKRMSDRANGVDVNGVRDLGPGWLKQWTRVLDAAWKAAEEAEAAA
jgi:hypothetical protein